MRIGIVWWVLAAAIVAADARAQELAPPGYPLQGLQAVTVSVLPPVLSEKVPDLTAEALQRLAEDTLRVAGVPVPKTGPAPQLSYLLLRLTVVDSAGGPRGYSADLRLMEVVTLSRDMKMKTQAATWYGGLSGPADQQDLTVRVNDAVRRVCQRFAADYTSANPKR